MGKASRRKAKLGVTESMREGVNWAAEMIRHPNVVPTSLTHSKMSPPRAANDDPEILAAILQLMEEHRDAQHPADLAPTEWAQRFMPALSNQRFVTLLQSIVERAHKSFWADKDPMSAVMFNGNTRPPDDDPTGQAIVRAHRKLVADPSGPGWVALTLFCLARMAAVNAKLGFDSDQWSDLTLLWFDLDTRMFDGDGPAVAKLILKLDRSFMKGQLTTVIGDRVRHGLGEAAINATDTTIFQ